MAWTPRVVWPDQLQAAALDRIGGAGRRPPPRGRVRGPPERARAPAGSERIAAAGDRRAGRGGRGARALVGAPAAATSGVAGATALALGSSWGSPPAGALRAAWPGVPEGVGRGGRGRDASCRAPPAARRSARWPTCAPGSSSGADAALAAHPRCPGAAPPPTAARRSVRRCPVRRPDGRGRRRGAGDAGPGLRAGRVGPGGTMAGGDTVAVAVRAPPRPGDGDGLGELLAARLARVPGPGGREPRHPGRRSSVSACGTTPPLSVGTATAGGFPCPSGARGPTITRWRRGSSRPPGCASPSGRAITRRGRPRVEAVAVVNRTFANEAFENGDPLGHLVELGADLDAWYEVVGWWRIATSPRWAETTCAPGRVRERAAAAAAIAPTCCCAGTTEAVDAASAVLAAAGYRPGGRAPLARSADARRPPLRVDRPRRAPPGPPDARPRRARRPRHGPPGDPQPHRGSSPCGACSAPPTAASCSTCSPEARGPRSGVAALAVFFGSLLVALLRKTAGGVPALGPGAYVARGRALGGRRSLARPRRPCGRRWRWSPPGCWSRPTAAPGRRSTHAVSGVSRPFRETGPVPVAAPTQPARPSLVAQAVPGTDTPLRRV